MRGQPADILGLLFPEDPGRCLRRLGIFDHGMQFHVNQLTPVVDVFGEGGHIVWFQQVLAEDRAWYVITGHLRHSLGRRASGLQELLECRLIHARPGSPRKHEFHRGHLPSIM